MSGQRERASRQRDRGEGEWLAVEDEESITVMDRVALRDRRYFLKHLGRSSYVRTRVLGEFGAYETDPGYALTTHTLVEQVVPGYRVRHPMILLRHRDYPSHIVPHEHIEAAQALTGATELFTVPDDALDDDESGDGMPDIVD